MSKKKAPKHSILIVCEGENTEPHFFAAIRDAILEGKYDVGHVSIQIQPEARKEDDESLQTPRHSRRKPRKRRTKAAHEQEPEDIKGSPPLKWVLEGKKRLQDGSADEVWAVFDHDKFETRFKKEAFEQAEEEVNGKKVQIAFSSLCFEYYLLMHFEQLYNAFQESECKAGRGRKPISCGENRHEDDCHGEICVNGYARTKGYWQESKKAYSLFPLIQPRLEQGFLNCVWLRKQSEIHEGNKPIHERNPYVNTDLLVKRLIGHLFDYECLADGERLQSDKLELVHQDGQLEVTNRDNCAFLLHDEIFVLWDGQQASPFPKRFRKLLKPQEIYIIPLPKKQIIFTHQYTKILI